MNVEEIQELIHRVYYLSQQENLSRYLRENVEKDIGVAIGGRFGTDSKFFWYPPETLAKAKRQKKSINCFRVSVVPACMETYEGAKILLKSILYKPGLFNLHVDDWIVKDEKSVKETFIRRCHATCFYSPEGSDFEYQQTVYDAGTPQAALIGLALKFRIHQLEKGDFV
jgi:hypothetical protein